MFSGLERRRSTTSSPSKGCAEIWAKNFFPPRLYGFSTINYNGRLGIRKSSGDGRGGGIVMVVTAKFSQDWSVCFDQSRGARLKYSILNFLAVIKLEVCGVFFHFS